MVPVSVVSTVGSVGEVIRDHVDFRLPTWNLALTDLLAAGLVGIQGCMGS